MQKLFGLADWRLTHQSFQFSISVKNNEFASNVVGGLKAENSEDANYVVILLLL